MKQSRNKEWPASPWRLARRGLALLLAAALALPNSPVGNALGTGALIARAQEDDEQYVEQPVVPKFAPGVVESFISAPTSDYSNPSREVHTAVATKKDGDIEWSYLYAWDDFSTAYVDVAYANASGDGEAGGYQIHTFPENNGREGYWLGIGIPAEAAIIASTENDHRYALNNIYRGWKDPRRIYWESDGEEGSVESIADKLTEVSDGKRTVDDKDYYTYYFDAADVNPDREKVNSPYYVAYEYVEQEKETNSESSEVQWKEVVTNGVRGFVVIYRLNFSAMEFKPETEDALAVKTSNDANNPVRVLLKRNDEVFYEDIDKDFHLIPGDDVKGLLVPLTHHVSVHKEGTYGTGSVKIKKEGELSDFGTFTILGGNAYLMAVASGTEPSAASTANKTVVEDISGNSYRYLDVSGNDEYGSKISGKALWLVPKEGSYIVDKSGTLDLAIEEGLLDYDIFENRTGNTQELVTQNRELSQSLPVAKMGEPVVQGAQIYWQNGASEGEAAKMLSSGASYVNEGKVVPGAALCKVEFTTDIDVELTENSQVSVSFAERGGEPAPVANVRAAADGKKLTVCFMGEGEEPVALPLLKTGTLTVEIPTGALINAETAKGNRVEEYKKKNQTACTLAIDVSGTYTATTKEQFINAMKTSGIEKIALGDNITLGADVQSQADITPSWAGAQLDGKGRIWRVSDLEIDLNGHTLDLGNNHIEFVSDLDSAQDYKISGSGTIKSSAPRVVTIANTNQSDSKCESLSIADKVTLSCTASTYTWAAPLVVYIDNFDGGSIKLTGVKGKLIGGNYEIAMDAEPKVTNSSLLWTRNAGTVVLTKGTNNEAKETILLPSGSDGYYHQGTTVANGVGTSSAALTDLTSGTGLTINNADAHLTAGFSSSATVASVAAAPAKISGLIHTGEAQALVTAGTAKNGESDGTMKYAVTTEDAAPEKNAYSNTIPTGIAAGKYYVWYYAVGDDNYRDGAPSRIEVEIAAASGAVTASSAAGFLTAMKASAVTKITLGGNITLGDNVPSQTDVTPSWAGNQLTGNGRIWRVSALELDLNGHTLDLGNNHIEFVSDLNDAQNYEISGTGAITSKARLIMSIANTNHTNGKTESIQIPSTVTLEMKGKNGNIHWNAPFIVYVDNFAGGKIDLSKMNAQLKGAGYKDYDIAVNAAPDTDGSTMVWTQGQGSSLVFKKGGVDGQTATITLPAGVDSENQVYCVATEPTAALSGTLTSGASVSTTANDQAFLAGFSGNAGDLISIKGEDYRGVYDGKAHTISLTGIPAGTTMKYGISSEGINSDTLPTLTDAGTQTVYWTATNGSHFYSGANTITIVKKTVTARADDQTITKGKNISNGRITYSGAISGETLTISGGTVSVYCKAGEGETADESGLVKVNEVTSLAEGFYILRVEGAETISAVTGGNANANNYQVSAETKDGVLTVLPAPGEGKIKVIRDDGTAASTLGEYDYNAPLNAFATPSRTGYTFAEWKFLKGSAETAWDFEKTIKANIEEGQVSGNPGSVTIYAAWNPVKYTITLNLGGGSISESGDDAELNYTIEDALTLPAPVKAGHTFVGWTGTGLTETTIVARIPQGSYGNRTYTANYVAYAAEGSAETDLTAVDAVSAVDATSMTESALDGAREADASARAAAAAVTLGTKDDKKANEVVVTVATKAEADTNTTGQAAIKNRIKEGFGNAVEANDLNTSFVDVTVGLQQNYVDGVGTKTIIQSTDKVADTQSTFHRVMALQPFVFDMGTGRHHPMAARYHGGTAQMLRELSEKPVNGRYEDATVYFEKLFGTKVIVYIYSSKFSTFGISSLPSSVTLQSITVYGTMEGDVVKTLASGATLTATAASKPGYTFVRWEDQLGNGKGNTQELSLTIGTESAGITSLTPVYEPAPTPTPGGGTTSTYRVTFQVGEHGTAPRAQIIAKGGKATEPTAPTAEGYVFGGWYTDQDCTTAYDFNNEVTSNLTLYAKWTEAVTVTFQVGEHGTAPVAQTIAKGGKATEPTAPTAEGYTFGGWYTDQACTTAYDFSTAVTTNLTLYAKWTEAVTVTFQVGEHGTAPGAQTIAKGGKATEPTAPTAESYVFGGWYTDQACTTAYDFNTAVTANLTLYAKWTEAVTVTFQVGEHGTAPGAQTIAKGDKATQPTAPTAEGYTFGGWYTDQACTTAYDFNTAVTANLTLYAKWTQNGEEPAAETFTVSFNMNGHGTQIAAATVKKGEKAIEPAAPTDKDYTFGGWYTDQACTTAYNFNTAVTANLTLYAKWTKNGEEPAVDTYTVAFDLQGHGTAIAALTVKKGDKAAKPATPAAEGYLFGGWYTDKDCTKAYNFNTAVTANLTLFAKWTAMEETTDISDGKGIVIEGLQKEYPYTGSAIKPALRVVDETREDGVLALGVDYTVSYKKNTKLGTAEVVVKGKGNYTGQGAQATFAIVDPKAGLTAEEKTALAALKGAKITTKFAAMPYTGEARYPAEIGLKLKGGSEVKYIGTVSGGDVSYAAADGKEIPAVVTFSNNVKAGTATVALTGSDRTLKKSFKISAVDLSKAAEADLQVDMEETAVWAVKGAVPRLAVSYLGMELIEGQDYKVTYKNNKKVGDKVASLTIAGKGNFSKKLAAKSFTVEKLDLSQAEIIATTAYSKVSAKSVKVTILDGAGDLIPASKLKVSVLKGAETFTGKLAAEDQITVTAEAKGSELENTASTEVTVGDNLGKASIKVDKALKKYYTGEAVMLTEEDMAKVTVKLSGSPLTYGEDYEIVGYTNNFKKGTMKVTIAAKEGSAKKLSGTKTFNVKILAKPVK